MQKKLKIAVYSGQIPSTTFIESLIKTLSVHHEIHLFGTQKKTVNYQNKNIKIYKTPTTNWLKLIYNIYRSLQLVVQHPKDLIALLKHLKNYKTRYKKWQLFSRLLPIILHKPDVLHIQWAKNLEDSMVLQTLFHIPIVLSLRGAHINYSPIACNKLAASYSVNFPKIAAFHAVSKAIGKEAEKYGAVNSKIHVIYSLVPKMFLDAYQALKPKTTNNIKIMSVGRSHWIKGYTYAIHAIALLKKQGYFIEYHIVGMNKPDEELLFLIDALGLQENVTILPNLAQKKLIAFMQTQDAMLLSSLKEGIANVVLEAMAVGLPVISTNCGGMQEVIIPRETGFLVPTRNADAIAQAVIDLYNMPKKELQEQTSNAHKLVKTHFNLENNSKQFLDLYKSVSN